MPRIPFRLPLLLLLAVLTMAGCGRTANLIPGQTPDGAPTTLGATPAPVVAPPILPPGKLELGSENARASLENAVSDAQLAASVVRIEAVDGQNVTRNGSAVVIDTPLRLLLTTYQLVNPFNPDGTRAYGSLMVSVSSTPGEPPTRAFEAQLVEADPLAGVAVLRVARHLDGRPVAGEEFGLAAAPIGDASKLARGDSIRLLGYPGIDPARRDAPQTVMATQAAVVGFRGEAGGSGRGWMKTDARLPSGHTGGPAFDTQGRLVGVAMQLAYAPAAVVGQVRPIDLASNVMESARNAGPEQVYAAPLSRRRLGPTADAGGLAVSKPAFAQNVIESPDGGDLFDYNNAFPEGLHALNYEFAVQGVGPGTLVEERWFLNGVLQDGLSSSFAWNSSGFAVVADRLASPNERGLQPGVWQLEVWVNDSVRAVGRASVGPTNRGGPPQAPTVSNFQFGASASPEQGPKEPATGGAGQLLGFFDYQGTGGARHLRWVVFRDGRVVYESPTVDWDGGEAGNWWAGYYAGGSVGPGFWEIEVYFDNAIAGVGGVQLF